SERVDATPSIVIATMGALFRQSASVENAPTLQLLVGLLPFKPLITPESLVSKFSPLVCAKMAHCPGLITAGRNALQIVNPTGPSFGLSVTVSALMVIGDAPVFFMPTAPESNAEPPVHPVVSPDAAATSTTELPHQGVGKKGLGRKSSAYPANTSAAA